MASALVVAVVVATNRHSAGPFAAAYSADPDAVAAGNSFSSSDFGSDCYCCCYWPLAAAGSALWRGADIAEAERKMEEHLRWMVVLSSAPSSVKAERRNHSASAVPMVVGIVVAAAGNAAEVVVGRSDEIAGRLGC